jgi:tetratricopeptide (TPR) repeat protein
LNKLSKLSVLYKINSKSDVGKVLSKKYSLIGVPTIILVSADGKEIDRIIGYDEKDDFLSTLSGYFFNVGTLDNLIEKSSKTPSADIFYKIAQKYYERGDVDNSLSTILKVREQPQLSDEIKLNSDLLEGECYLKKDKTKGIEILLKLVDSANPNISDSAFEDLSRFFYKTEDYDSLYNLYKKILPKKSNDPQFLNSFAWTMSEIGKNLDEALSSAKKAVELSKEDPQVLDTLAEIYYKMGDSKSAVATIDKAIAKEPSDEYYKRQKEKFLTTKSTKGK